MADELYDFQVERILLGSMIFEPDLIGEGRVLGLEASHFFMPFHQKLFELLERQYFEGVVDEELIASEMGRAFDEKEMLQIMTVNPTRQIAPYVERMVEMANLRNVREMAQKLISQIDGEERDYGNVLKTLHEEIDRLDYKSSFLSLRNIGEVEAKEAEFVCRSWLPFPKKAVSLVTAGGGAGKSFLMMQAAMRMVSEEGLRVFMWLSEDPAELSRHRFEMIAGRVIGQPPEHFEKKLFLAASDTETIHFLQEDRSSVSVNSDFYRFRKMLEGFDVIILDPLIAFFGGDENNNTHARQFINLFSRWANVENKTIVFIHHGTKNTSQSRGASAFVDAVRLAYQVDIVKNKEGEQIEEHNRLITIAKDNNGAKKYLGGHQVKRKVFPEQKRGGLKIEMVEI